MKERNRTKCLRGILICVLVFCVIVFGMRAYAMYPEMQMNHYLKNQDYKRAANMYNEYFAGTEQAAEYAEVFLEHIKEIKSRWKEQEITYKQALMLLDEMIDVEEKEVQSEAKRMKAFILVEGNAEIYYKEAVSCYEKNDYQGTLENLAKIDESYLGYANVEKLIDECVEIILLQTKRVDSVKEYETWIVKLGEYYTTIPEPSFLTRKTQLEQELDVFKDVLEMLKEAADFYERKNYANAFAVLYRGLNKYPDYEKIKTAYLEYHEKYVDLITREVKEACGKEEYNRAFEILEAAREIHECEEFAELSVYVKEEKSILYRWKNNIVNFFEKWKE